MLEIELDEELDVGPARHSLDLVERRIVPRCLRELQLRHVAAQQSGVETRIEQGVELVRSERVPVGRATVLTLNGNAARAMSLQVVAIGGGCEISLRLSLSHVAFQDRLMIRLYETSDGHAASPRKAPTAIIRGVMTCIHTLPTRVARDRSPRAQKIIAWPIRSFPFGPSRRIVRSRALEGILRRRPGIRVSIGLICVIRVFALPDGEQALKRALSVDNAARSALVHRSGPEPYLALTSRTSIIVSRCVR